MTVFGLEGDSAAVARRLADVAGGGTAEELSGEIQSAQTSLARLSTGGAGSSSFETERVELLAAIVEAMRGFVARFGRHAESPSEFRAVCLGLLHHLARRPRNRTSSATLSEGA